MAPRSVVVLSDLHLGPGGPLTTFREGAALAAYLRGLEPGVELVLAGDTFDLLQSPGYAGLDPSKSADRLGAILDANADVVAALKALAAKPEVEVTLLAGNHDPELLLFDVRARFEEAIGRRGSVLHPDDEPLVQAQGERLPVRGRALASGGRTVWVVHGERWDPANVIDRDRLLRAAADGRPVPLPPGSHLVFEVLSDLKVDHPWVDELKPEPAVVPLLLYLEPKRTWAYLTRHAGLTLDLLHGAVLAAASAHHPTLTSGPDPSQEAGDDGPLDAAFGWSDAASELADRLARALEPGDDPDRLVGQLQLLVERGAGPRSVGPTLAAHEGARRWLLRTWLASLRHADRFQALDGPDATIARVARHLPREVDAVVAGHTHGPRFTTGRRRDGSTFRYVNTGTWVPISAIPAGELRARIDQLDERRRWPSRPPRTLARIELAADRAPFVRLVRLNDAGREEPA